MSGINVSDSAMQAAVASAIIQQLTPEKREELLRDAIASLLTPKDTGYGYGNQKKSPLQEAFERAVHSLAMTVVREKLETDAEIRAQIESVMIEGVRRATVERREETVEKIAKGIGAYLSFER